MDIQGKAGQAPINAECGPFGMATIDTSKWGRQQDLQKPAGQVSAAENLFKNGLKFLNKAADATAVGAALIVYRTESGTFGPQLFIGVTSTISVTVEFKSLAAGT